MDTPVEVLQFRPLSQFVNSLVIPEIQRRLDVGLIKESDLPLEIDRLRIVYDPATHQPITQLNEQVAISLQVDPIAIEGLSVGQPVYLHDIKPGSALLKRPEVDGNPAAFILFHRSFIAITMVFDLTPLLPGSVDPVSTTIPFPIELLAHLHGIYVNRPPKQLFDALRTLKWPPSPALYPGILDVFPNDGSHPDPDVLLDKVSSLLSAEYWRQRIATWREFQIFGDRLGYIEKSIDEHFAGDYTSSIYVLVPQFEGAIKSYVHQIKGDASTRFKEILGEFKSILLSRKALLFPKQIISVILDFIDSDTFWSNTTTVTDQRGEINRHGVAHGVFIGFENRALSLKFLALADCLAFLLIQDAVVSRAL